MQEVNRILLIKYNLILKLEMKKLVLKFVILCGSYLSPSPFYQPTSLLQTEAGVQTYGLS